MRKMLINIFKPEPRNKKVFLLFADGQIIGYSLCGSNQWKDRIETTLYCFRNDLRGILILRSVSASHVADLVKTYKFLHE